VTGRQVLDYLVENKYIAVATNSDGRNHSNRRIETQEGGYRNLVATREGEERT